MSSASLSSTSSLSIETPPTLQQINAQAFTSSTLPLNTPLSPASAEKSSWLITKIFKGIYGYAYTGVEKCVTLLTPVHLQKHTSFYKCLSVAIMITGTLLCFASIPSFPHVCDFLTKQFTFIPKFFENFLNFSTRIAEPFLKAAGDCFSILSSSLILRGISYVIGAILALVSLICMIPWASFVLLSLASVLVTILLPGLLVILTGKVLWDKVNAASLP